MTISAKYHVILHYMSWLRLLNIISMLVLVSLL